MSRVTSIVLVASYIDEGLARAIFTDIAYEDGQDRCPEPCVVEPETHGPKVIEVEILYAAWNYAYTGGLWHLVANFAEAKWEAPGVATILITPEDYSAAVLKADETAAELGRFREQLGLVDPSENDD